MAVLLWHTIKGYKIRRQEMASAYTNTDAFVSFTSHTKVTKYEVHRRMMVSNAPIHLHDNSSYSCVFFWQVCYAMMCHAYQF
jgi:hypothetical protein